MQTTIEDYYWLLPGLEPHEVTDWYILPDVQLSDGSKLRFPKLTNLQLDTIFSRMLAARQLYLKQATTRELIELIVKVREYWLDYDYKWRANAENLLPQVTGYSLPMIRRGLDDYLSIFKRDNLKALIRAELGDLDILDTFLERRLVSGRSRAYGPKITTHIFSGNVPGLAAQSLLMALLLKSSSLGKLASGEPIFATLFARSIVELEPRLAECFALTWWPGGEAPELENLAFARSDAVIAYGSEKAVRSVAAKVPVGCRFLGYGHRLSFGLIGKEALQNVDSATQLATRAAYDVAKFDQQGCVSPHLFYVEEGGRVSPKEWAALLANQLKRWGQNLPQAVLNSAESSAIAALRRDFEFRASFDPENVALFTGTDMATVAFESDPIFGPSCLNRTILVKPISNAEDVVNLVAPLKVYLQTAALALEPKRRDLLASKLGEVGVTRICPVGKMPDPDVAWHHDGRFNLLDLVYWTDIEEGYPL